jgi:YHS domain-containing protein
MQVDEQDALTASYRGQTFYFDSDECREEFLEAPEDYVMEEVQFLSEDEF